MVMSRGSLPTLRWLTALFIGCLVGPSSLSAQVAGAFQVTAVNGTLLGRADGGWQSLKAIESVANPGTTLIALFEADLKGAGGVAIKMLGDIGEFGPLPVLDTTIRILEPGKADAAMELDHGVVDVT